MATIEQVRYIVTADSGTRYPVAFVGADIDLTVAEKKSKVEAYVQKREDTSETLTNPTAEDAIRRACHKVDGWSGKASSTLAADITERVRTIVPDRATLLRHAVSVAVGAGMPEQEAYRQMEIVHSAEILMADARRVIGNQEHKGLVALLELAKARVERVKGSPMDEKLANGLADALQAYARSRVQVAADTLNIDPPSEVTAQDVQQALGREGS